MCYCYWLNEQVNIEGRPEKTGHTSGVLPNSQLSTKILTKPRSALGAVGGDSKWRWHALLSGGEPVPARTLRFVWRCCPDSKDKGLTRELGKIWKERSFLVEGPLGRQHGGGTM